MTLKFAASFGKATNFGVNSFFTWIADGELLLDPPFQRGSVWTTEQQEAWILSILDGVPLPAIFINQPRFANGEWGHLMCVIDGKQRIEAMIAFQEDRLLVKGQKFSEQSDGFRREWRQQAMPVVFTDFATKAECADLYVRLLICGTAHTDEEIEKARAMVDAEKEENS